ncbi:hypothetical protein GCM10007276_32000 [Agaricicola taiwanensis]|uniref:MmgE/PrpD family protein n=1 Tax=Agaricicola taiwanensis TaxID=591372 RepID=A0A8J3DZX2_9RHOB|nr:MmgE/PrpD family protein [Agaricicola taiwanensis]GGE52584.1 hypothetical protein GCM10007276_32000 [Agaricicola taiwanensis]
MSAVTTGATRRLAEFAAALSYDDIPAEVQRLMPTLLIDLFRVAAVGRNTTWVAQAEKTLSSLGGAPAASLFYSDRKADPIRAAYLNGVIAGSLDWDDSHIAAIVHPGVVIWPAALAAAEMVDADGRALVEAVTAAYEVAIRIGISVQPDHSLRGFQGTPACGVFGAAVAAARLFGLDADGIQNALGLTASYASGLAQFFVSGSDVKRLHAGKAAAQGLEAAILARAGLTGPPDAIEGSQGFGQAVSDSFDAARITEGLGSRYWINSISLKVHAGTVRFQAAIEAGEALAREGVDIAEIERIEIGVPRLLINKLTYNDPIDQQAALVSAPFAVALALWLTPRRPAPLVVGLDDFATYVHDPVIRGVATRTQCVFDPDIDAAMTAEYVPARVKVTLRNGRSIEKIIPKPKGCPENPITPEEVSARYRLAVAAHRAPDQAEAWLGKARDVARLSRASALMD